MQMDKERAEELLNQFLIRHCDEVVDPFSGEVLPFTDVEPYLQDFCSVESVSYLEMRAYLIDEGWVEFDYDEEDD